MPATQNVFLWLCVFVNFCGRMRLHNCDIYLGGARTPTENARPDQTMVVADARAAVQRDLTMTPSAIAFYCRAVCLVVDNAQRLYFVLFCACSFLSFEIYLVALRVHNTGYPYNVLQRSEQNYLQKFPARLHRHMSGQRTHTVLKRISPAVWSSRMLRMLVGPSPGRRWHCVHTNW